MQWLEAAGCRQGVQWLDAFGSRQEVQWLEAAVEVQEMHMHWLGATGQMGQQEAVVTPTVEAAMVEAVALTKAAV